MRLDAELFQAMIEVQQAVAAAGLDSQTVMRVIADRGLRLTGATGAVIESIEGEELVPQVHIGTEAPRLRLADSLSGLCVRTGELQRSDDVLADPRDRARRLPGHRRPLPPRRAAHRRAAHPRRAQGGVHPSRARSATAMPRRSASSAGSWARHWATPRRTRAGSSGWRSAPAPCRRASSGSSSWWTWRRRASGWRTTAASSPTSTSAWPSCSATRTARCSAGGSTTSSRRARAPAPSARWRGLRPRAGRAATSASFATTAASCGDWSRPVRSWAATASVGTVGMVTDITERKQAEERLRRSAERLGILHDMGQAILAARSPAEIGRAALGRIRRMVPCQRCSIVLFDFTRGQAQPVAGFTGGQAHLRRADSARHPLARRGAPSRHGPLRRGHRPRWNRRRRSSGSSARTGSAACCRSRSWWTARPSAR